MASATTATKVRAKSGRPTGLVLIGAYKLFEAAALLALGIGLLKLLHKDISALAIHWVHALRADPDNRLIHGLLARIFRVNEKQLRELSTGTFIYSGLRLIEGIGLVMRKRWGEYFTVIVTALFIPLEVYEMIRRFTPLRFGFFAVNVAIVWYLIVSIRRNPRVGAR